MGPSPIAILPQGRQVQIIQIHVLQIQASQRCLKLRHGILVDMVECLRGYEQVLPLAASLLDAYLYCLPKDALILVVDGSIDVAVAGLESSLEDIESLLLVCKLIGAEANHG